MKYLITTLLLIFSSFTVLNGYESSNKFTFDDLKILIMEESKKHHVNHYLIYALVEYESLRATGYDLEKAIKVRSRAGAVGLGQIMPIHARLRNMPISKLEIPEINIKLTCQIFADQVRIAKKRGYKNIIAESLRCYNQGAGRGNGIVHRNRYRDWNSYVYPVIRRAIKIREYNLYASR
jgi:soluble lytic murein transglycosylase-like protein